MENSSSSKRLAMQSASVINWEAIKTLGEFKKVLKEKKHTLLIVIFTAEWCRPCHQMNFALPSIIQMFPEVVFYKIDVDENLETANTYSIACVPTVRIYCNEKKLHENFGWNSDRLTRAINVCKDLYKSQLMPGGPIVGAIPPPNTSLQSIHSQSALLNNRSILFDEDKELVKQPPPPPPLPRHHAHSRKSQVNAAA